MSVFAGSYRMPADFAKRIKWLRQRFSLSQQQFADLIDISVPLLKQWENGQVQPSIHYWQRIVLAETEGIKALNQGGGKLPRSSSTPLPPLRSTPAPTTPTNTQQTAGA